MRILAGKSLDTFFLLLILVLLVLPLPVRSEPRTWIVDDDGPADFHVIQEAVDAAAPGDIIYVRDGNYCECVTVDKTIGLFGEDLNGVLLTSSTEGVATLYITADNVTLSGFTVKGHPLIQPPPGHPTPAPAIIVTGSCNNISGNTIGFCRYGIAISGSSHTLEYSTVTMCVGGVDFFTAAGNASDCTARYNNVTLCSFGLTFSGCSNVTVEGNNFLENADALSVYDNVPSVRIFHNNLINNSHDLFMDDDGTATWDDGYPSGGNFWSVYSGVDLYHGLDQKYGVQPGSDGIGDSNSGLFANDKWPLMKPYPWNEHDLSATYVGKVYFETAPTLVYPIIVPLKTVIGSGFTLHFNTFVFNYGSYAETFNVTTYANSTMIYSMPDHIVDSRNCAILNCTWNTSGFALGNYSLTASIDPVDGETDINDNNSTQHWIVISIPGDITGPTGYPDSRVDMRDIAIIARQFGSVIIQPTGWDSNLDINDDCKLDMIDIGTAARNFGKICP